MYCPSKIAIAAGQDACSSTLRFGSAAPWVHEICLQPIVDRQECVIGYETLARISADAFGANMERDIGALSLNTLGKLTSEVLLGLRICCMLETHYTWRKKSELAPAAVRHFVNVEKLSLTDPAIVEELIESAADLRSSGARLVVDVAERPVATPAQFNEYLRGLVRLKQEEVLVALDDYDLNSPVHWELDLGLCDVMKFELGSLGIVEPNDESNFAIRHAVLAEKLFEMIYRYRVELLAERVETDWQYEVVKGLPFNLFQGYRFGRPERI